MTYENKWTYNGNDFETSDIGNYFGFCYLLTNLKTGRKYIGKKNFFSNRKDPKKKRKRIIKESDWQNYYSSCEDILNELAAGEPKETFKREILSLHKTQGLLNYNETRWQFLHDVLVKVNDKGEPLYYNLQILSRYYAKNIRDKD